MKKTLLAFLVFSTFSFAQGLLPPPEATAAQTTAGTRGDVYISPRRLAGAATGNVTGPATSTANAIPRFSNTTGKVLLDSGSTIDANGTVTLTGTGSATAGLLSLPATATAKEQGISFGDTFLYRNAANQATLYSPGAGTPQPVLTLEGAGLYPQLLFKGTGGTGSISSDGGTGLATYGNLTLKANSSTIGFSEGNWTAYGSIGFDHTSRAMLFKTGPITTALTLDASQHATLPAAGGASAPTLNLTGAWYTAGTTTTAHPHLYLNSGGGVTTNIWNQYGTGLGFNAPAAFAGNFLDCHVSGGASVFKVAASGDCYSQGGFVANGAIYTTTALNTGFTYNGAGGLNVILDNAARISLLASGAATFSGAVTASAAAITAGTGTGLTVNETAAVNRTTHKVTTTYAAFAAAALTSDKVIATLPAKTRLLAVYADCTATFGDGAVNVTDADFTLGNTAGGSQYLATFDVFSAAGQVGLADADMGTELTRAAAIQGSAVVTWAATTDVTARLTVVGANASTLTTGSITWYLVTEKLP